MNYIYVGKPDVFVSSAHCRCEVVRLWPVRLS